MSLTFKKMARADARAVDVVWEISEALKCADVLSVSNIKAAYKGTPDAAMAEAVCLAFICVAEAAGDMRLKSTAETIMRQHESAISGEADKMALYAAISWCWSWLAFRKVLHYTMLNYREVQMAIKRGECRRMLHKICGNGGR